MNGIQHQSYWICKNYINLFQSHSSRGLRTRQPSTLPTGDVSEVVQTQSQRHHDGNAREITTPTGVEVPKHDITPDHREVWPRHSILLPPPYRSGEFFLPLSLPNCNSWSSTPIPPPTPTPRWPSPIRNAVSGPVRQFTRALRATGLHAFTWPWLDNPSPCSSSLLWAEDEARAHTHTHTGLRFDGLWWWKRNQIPKIGLKSGREGLGVPVLSDRCRGGLLNRAKRRQSHPVDCQLKIWLFCGLCTRNYPKWAESWVPTCTRFFSQATKRSTKTEEKPPNCIISDAANKHKKMCHFTLWTI